MGRRLHEGWWREEGADGGHEDVVLLIGRHASAWIASPWSLRLGAPSGAGGAVSPSVRARLVPYEGPLSPRMREAHPGTAADCGLLVRSIASGAKKETGMADEFWIAQVETRNTQSLATGRTPEEALAAMLECWRERYAPVMRADPDYLDGLREETKIGRAVMGKGYVLGAIDSLWFEEIVAGDHPRLEETWNAARAPSPSPSR